MTRLTTRVVVGIAFLAMLPGASAAAPGSNGGQQQAEAALQRVKDLKHGIGVRTGRELTPALAEMNRTKQNLDAAGRKEADALLARPTDGNADPQGDGYTVPEHTPDCGVHFCIHYVTTTADAPDLTDNDNNGIPDYVDLMLQVFEGEVFPCENGTAALGCADAGTVGLGWPAAPSDGTLGGDSRFDVYIKDLFPQNIFGYVAPDPQPAGSSLFSYLVLDKDFSRFSATLSGPDEMRVTAAHEYNHVLQFGIDANEDTWMFESTATFFENEVYPGIDDYLSYMNTWVNSTADPLTSASGGGGLKIYGSAVWNHFIAGRHGPPTILQAWQAKTQGVGSHRFAPASYDTAIAANGGTGFSDEFDDFSAAVAEWRVPGSGFPDTYPDVPAAARPNMTVGAAGTTIQLDHTTFAFRNIAPPASPVTLTLTATLPAGLEGAIALVGRTGNSTTAGTVTKRVQRLSSGGAATVSLPNADTYGRITAVLVNADTTQTGFSNGKQDWVWSNDKQNFTGVRVTSAVPPSVTTDAASGVGLTSATLNGHVNPNGFATTYFFDYGTTTAYGSQIPLVPAGAGSGSSSQAFSVAVSGLTRGTTYHYRIVANNAGGTIQGGDATFTTLDPPIVSTDAATAITVDGGTLNATVDARGRSTSFVFEYGPTAAYGNQIPLAPGDAGSGVGAVPVSEELTGLGHGTTIHYRVVATNIDGTTAGSDKSFKTLDPPVVTTGNAVGISQTAATLTGEVDPRGRPTSFLFEYGTTTAYGSQVAGDAGNGSGPVSVASGVTGLTPGTLYHFHLSATNADGTTTGSDGTFTTPAAPSPNPGGGSGTSPVPPGETAPSPSGGAPATPGGAATTAPKLTLSIAVVKAKLLAVLKKGLRVRARCSESCTVRVKLTLPAKIARKLRIKTTIATARGKGGSRLILRIDKKARRALARLRKVTATLAVTATTRDGRRAAVTKKIALRR